MCPYFYYNTIDSVLCTLSIDVHVQVSRISVDSAVCTRTSLVYIC